MAETKLHVPEVRLPLMKQAPTIDGTVNDAEWSGAARMERFAGSNGRLSPQEASFWVGCDGKELFIAVVSETPPGGKILSRVTPLPENADARTWSDDSIEVVLDPLRTDKSGRRRLYHANINERGAISDTAYNPAGGGEAWRGRWRTASKVIGDRWHYEAALPLTDMGVTEADLAQPWGIRVVRNWQQHLVGPPQTEWSPLGGVYLSPDTMPVVTSDTNAPVVQVLQLREPGKSAFHARFAIRNPGAEAMSLKVSVKVVPKNSAHTTWERTVNVPPGEPTILDVPAASIGNEELYVLMRVASADDATVYYLRDCFLTMERPETLWAIDPDAAKKVDVSFAYFPYHNTIKSIVNVTGLEERDKVRSAKLSVRKVGQASHLSRSRVAEKDKQDARPTLVATTLLPAFQKHTSQVEWKIPPLKEGAYEFVVELDGVKVQPIVTEFVRHILPWEHNKLGRSDVVIEPFTPIRVDRCKHPSPYPLPQGEREQTGESHAARISSPLGGEDKGEGNRSSTFCLSTILRKHWLNDLGLWDQVESEGKPLLKSPMRLEVNGVPVTGKKLRFVEKRPTHAIAESSWSGGKIRTEWDYDGMMKWTLDIQPSKVPIDSMTLVIPLDDRPMPLFHACTDGLRFNYAGATPAGSDRVWDGSKAARNSIIGSYVPYIWLGAEERGLAVFGENDRGWGRDSKVPCQELVRNGDTLELRLNLIAAPLKVEQARRIVVGFQATPTKPMPADWRMWTVNMSSNPHLQRNIQFLGCCYQWGALTPYDDIYPRDEDFSVYDKLAEARRTGEVDRPWLEAWIAATKLPKGADVASFRSNLDYGFRLCAGKPQNVIAYTNPRAFRLDTREGQTFLDEWHVDAFLSRKANYGDGSSYGCNPVESFRDYSMWYYRKMLDTFNDHINWDNTYLKACFDTVGSDAYELSPGVIQPSVGLWNMRELIRRTAVLGHEMKKRPMNMPHTTNTGIAPIHSFAQTHLTWEDRQGDSDFQDRFSREYIRAESIGRQHGNIPFALVSISGPDESKNNWAGRTAAGVLMTHEIKAATIPDVYRDNLIRLLQFGYGKPDVRVFNYWQPGNPVRVEGSDVSTLVVSKPGSAMIVVCDYGNGGNLTVTVDTKALGLKSGFGANDVETGEKLSVVDGKVAFPLKRHDFRMLVLE